MEDVVPSDLRVSCDWLKRTLTPCLSPVGRSAVTNWLHLLLGVWWWW